MNRTNRMGRRFQLPRSVAGVLLIALSAGLLSGCDVIRVFYPSHTYESEPPELPAELPRPAILLFTKSNGFRHGEAIEAGTALFEQMAAEQGWSLFHTENGAVFNAEQLARFDVAVWHNTSGDVLNETQKSDFVQWLEAGGGFVGIHGTGGDFSYDWEWQVSELIGAQFIGHVMDPQFQPGAVIVEDHTHPATRDLPATWTQIEEWYSFDQSVREKPGFDVLASVDEASYTPRMKILWIDRDLSMGDHPVVWSHCIGRGRSFYSALGHQGAAYAIPEHRALLRGAIAWAARLEGVGCGDGSAASR